VDGGFYIIYIDFAKAFDKVPKLSTRCQRRDFSAKAKLMA
jgi:hypothetical protein